MTLHLGIDIGTSGVRTAVLDGGRNVVATARADHLPQDPNKIDAEKWWRAVEICLHNQMDALQSNGRSGKEITGIAVDGTSGSMVFVDAQLKPVTRALMYNSKGFNAEAAAIAKLAPETHITRGSNSALARAMRLLDEADTEPAHLLHQADYIAARLTQRGGHSDANNALKTGFDPATGAWPEWIDEVLPTALLPRAHPIGEPISQIAGSVAAEFGISPEAIVHAGTTDSIAAFLAAAPMKSGVAVTSLGSTLAVKYLSANRVDNPSTGLYSHKVRDVWLAGGASNTGGAVLAHYFSAEELQTLSADIDLTKTPGLDYYPLLVPGERFPINDPELAPRLEPRPQEDRDFLHAMLEAMARIETQCYRSIAEHGGGYPEVIYTAGGGARNPSWVTMRENALGVPIKLAQSSEASVGAATLAGLT